MTKVVVHACGDANSWKRRRRTRLYIWNGCKSGMLMLIKMGATPWAGAKPANLRTHRTRSKRAILISPADHLQWGTDIGIARTPNPARPARSL